MFFGFKAAIRRGNSNGVVSARNEKRWRATAVQDAGAFPDASRNARSVLECATPLALWAPHAETVAETVGKIARGPRVRKTEHHQMVFIGQT